MKTYDEKLRAALRSVMEEEWAAVEEELKHVEPHVFSDRFNRRMEEVMRVREKKKRRSDIVRYVAAAIVTVLLVGGILFVGSKDLQASKFNLEIVEWFEKFFTMEEGEDTREEDDILFEESQIGYIPEGFEKVEESVRFSRVYYKNQNAQEDYFILHVHRDKTTSFVDNEEIEQNIGVNEDGFEYRYIYKEDMKENIVSWADKEDIYYYLRGTLEKEEIIKIMDGITYREK